LQPALKSPNLLVLSLATTDAAARLKSSRVTAGWQLGRCRQHTPESLEVVDLHADIR